MASNNFDTGVAAHYGDPLREQRLLEQGAVVDLSHRGVLNITGADRLSWLHSLTTQHVVDLTPGASAETLVLSPKGHIEYALHVVDDGERTWVTVEPGAALAVTAWLESMRFMLRVEVADVSDRYAVLGEAQDQPWTPDLAPVEAVWVDSWPALGPDTASYGEPGAHPASGRRWRELILPRASLEAVVGERPLAGAWAAEAERISAWRPRQGVETDHRSIPHELDWLRTAVHLHKGCYRGQETVARVHNLGRPPRRLVFLHLDGSDHLLPEPLSPIHREGVDRPVGQLMSVARHYEDGPIGLAMIKRNTPVEATLRVGTIAATQTVIVAPE